MNTNLEELFRGRTLHVVAMEPGGPERDYRDAAYELAVTKIAIEHDDVWIEVDLNREPPSIVDAFSAYFDVADELDGGLTLADLDRDFVADANSAATRLGLPWPPNLADAEEHALRHPEHRGVESTGLVCRACETPIYKGQPFERGMHVQCPRT